MTVADLLSASKLQRNEAEILLAALLRKDRTWILAHPEQEVSESHLQRWRTWEQRRLAHEPIVYITGEKEFYGRPFTVDARVLVPRPATEGLVGVALAFLAAPSDSIVPTDAGIVAVSRILKKLPVTTVVDVGTGSGAIAITLALERPDLTFVATDISEGALDVAQRNAERHNVRDRIAFLHGSCLDPILKLGNPFLLVSNPPYVCSDRRLPRDVVEYEPSNAIFAGPEGLDVIRIIVQQAIEHPACCGIVMECEEGHVKEIDRLLQ